ncbi:MAG: porphobilinogen synthase [Pirellulaceae bacterium]|nr:porphobilinogen synthase [Pirellulaceae bacterium]
MISSLAYQWYHPPLFATFFAKLARLESQLLTTKKVEFMSSFPTTRLRRLRYNSGMRRLLQKTHLRPDHLILPLFVRSGKNIRQPIPSMPGQYQLSLDELAKEIQQIKTYGLGGVILFGIPEEKDELGSDSYSDDGIIQRAIATVKEADPDMFVCTDVCLCEYTDHGHCGFLHEKNGRYEVDNDRTLVLLQKQVLSHARAGVDLLAPSGMMDGMIGAIRSELDKNNFSQLPVMSYAVKYHSAFYGPFRQAAESAPQQGDRCSYQMDYTTAPELALREVELDLAEGADLIMIKPAMAYLDIISLVKQKFPSVPLAAYNVSGEYSLIQAAAANGWVDQKQLVFESLTAIHRAGAEIILTYWAKEVAHWLDH